MTLEAGIPIKMMVPIFARTHIYLRSNHRAKDNKRYVDMI